MPITTIRWRIFTLLQGKRYYANRCSNTPPPSVEWHTFEQEYPDHFTIEETTDIRAHYSDQQTFAEPIQIVEEEEDYG